HPGHDAALFVLDRSGDRPPVELRKRRNHATDEQRKRQRYVPPVLHDIPPQGLSKVCFANGGRMIAPPSTAGNRRRMPLWATLNSSSFRPSAADPRRTSP